MRSLFAPAARSVFTFLAFGPWTSFTPPSATPFAGRSTVCRNYSRSPRGAQRRAPEDDREAVPVPTRRRLGQPRGGPAPSLADLPPPWHHPHPAPPPERCGATEKLGLQAKVIAHKLEDLERSASDASALLGEILRGADAEASRGTDPSATLRRLARVVGGLRRDAEALVALDARETTLAARARDDPGPSETDGTLRSVEDTLRALLAASASAGARVAQLVQVGAILEVAGERAARGG